jgi:hypothetical protein
MVRVGDQCAKFMDETMVNLSVKKLHVGEIWTYCGKHQKYVTPEEDQRYIGDQYVFVAMDGQPVRLCTTFHCES